MRIITLTILAIGLLAGCKNTEKTKTNAKNTGELTNETDSMSYAIGISVASGIYAQGARDINEALVAEGFKNVFNKDSLKMEVVDANQYLNIYFSEMGAKVGENNKKEGEEFLEANKNNEGVKTTPSGMQYKVLKEGEGESPKSDSKVTTHYEGTLIDGKVFDSSYKRGEPAVFPVNGVIAGWTEALQMMKPGGKWRLWIPGHLAYGDRGAGELIGPNQLLIFDVELISFE